MSILEQISRWLCKLTLISCLISPAFADDKLNFEIKAAYLYQIMNYTHWENNKSSNTICLISPVNIENYFLSIEGKLFKEQPVQIKHFTTIEAPSNSCNLLFFASGSEDELAAWSEKNHQGVVTVADNQLVNGELAMIQLLRQATKLKFVAHNSIAINNRVTFSSRLLRVAYFVD